MVQAESTLNLVWGDQRDCEIDVKRFSVPFTATSDCPECGNECDWDDQLSYPGLGTPEKLTFYCEDGHNPVYWSETVILAIMAAPTGAPAEIED